MNFNTSLNILKEYLNPNSSNKRDKKMSSPQTQKLSLPTHTNFQNAQHHQILKTLPCPHHPYPLFKNRTDKQDQISSSSQHPSWNGTCTWTCHHTKNYTLGPTERAPLQTIFHSPHQKISISNCGFWFSYPPNALTQVSDSAMQSFRAHQRMMLMAYCGRLTLFAHFG